MNEVAGRNCHDDYHNLLFGVRRSVRYHNRRRRFYTALHKSQVFGSLLLASVTVMVFAGVIGGEWPLSMKTLPAVLVSVLAGLDLVFGSVDKTWLHADLERQFIGLERQLEAARDNPMAELIVQMTDRRLDIERQEPPVLRVLDTLCHNELAHAMGYGAEQQVRVSFWQRLFANFFDLADHRLGRA